MAERTSLTTPKRVQLSRKRGYRKPAGAIVVARPSRWGNPWRVGQPVWRSLRGAMDGADPGRYDPHEQRWFDTETEGRLTAEEAVTLYRDALVASLADGHPYFDGLRAALAELRGHDLACWCPLDDGQGHRVPCHADVLIDLANATPGDGGEG